MYDIPPRPPIEATHASLILTVPAGRTDAAAALGDWVGFLNGSDLDYELLLVGEQALQSVEELAAPFARVRALSPPEQSGFGAALAVGLAHTQHPLVFYTRCVPGYKPADLKQLLKAIDKVDLVAGQRDFFAARHRGALYRWFVRMFFGVRLHDLGCLFVLARRSIFARIPIQSHGLFAHTEVLAKANFLGCYFSDVAISFRPDPAPIPSDERWLKDARRVIADPDFGPAQLPAEPASQAAGPPL